MPMTAKYHLDSIVNFLQSRNASAEVKGHADPIYEQLEVCDKLAAENMQLIQDNATLVKENTKLVESNTALSLALKAAGGKK